MKLVLVFDHRFYRRRDGQICGHNVYNYDFFAARYLRVFDEVSILARVAESDDPQLDTIKTAEGPALKIVPLPDWNGAFGFLKHRSRIIRTAISTIREGDAVLMIVPGGLASTVFGTLSKRDQPIAVEVVGDPWDAFQPGAYDHPLRSILRRFLARTLRKQCRAACAASYVTNSFLQSRYPCSGLSTGISDVVLPRSAFATGSRNYGPAPAKKLVCVANMNKYKGHNTLLDALVICQRAGLLLDATLVGGGDLRCELESKVQQLGLAKQVRFAGQLPAGEAVRRELENADLFVLSSLQEGMPRAMLEAMARALPCVASEVGGVPEILSPDAMVPKGDAQALAVKLQTVMGDPAWLTQTSQRNLQKATDYREDVLAARRLEFYRYIRQMNGPKARGPSTITAVAH
jgi:glycosyltransferase involved in cell wall biosynthesis